ncbi:hypothetical protein O95_01571 [Bartonella henselae JK 53]|nr:hypothetical protein O95_01571 [Bartonella henselae JK 53]
MPTLGEDTTTLCNDVLFLKLCEALLTHEAMEGIAVLLANMSRESVELINRLDVIDMVAVFKAFFAFLRNANPLNWTTWSRASPLLPLVSFRDQSDGLA